MMKKTIAVKMFIAHFKLQIAACLLFGHYPAQIFTIASENL